MNISPTRRTLVRPMPQVCPQSLRHRRMARARWAWPFHLRRHHRISLGWATPVAANVPVQPQPASRPVVRRRGWSAAWSLGQPGAVSM